MNFIEEGPLREKFLRMGRKLGWSDVPNLDDKIAVLQKATNGIDKKSKSGLTFTDNREEMALDDDKLTSYDIVDCDDDSGAAADDDDGSDYIDDVLEDDGNFNDSDGVDDGIDDSDSNHDGNDEDDNVGIDHGVYKDGNVEDDGDDDDNIDGIIDESDDTGDNSINGNVVNIDGNTNNDDDGIIDDSDDVVYINDDCDNDDNHNVYSNIDNIQSDLKDDNANDNDGSDEDNYDDIDDSDDDRYDVNNDSGCDNDNGGDNDDNHDDDFSGGSDDGRDNNVSDNEDNHNDSENHDNDPDENQKNQSSIHDADSTSMANYPKTIPEEFPTLIGHGMQLDIPKNEDQVTEDKDGTDECIPLEDFEKFDNIDGHNHYDSFKEHDFGTSNSKLFNAETTETTDETEINNVSQLMEPCSYTSIKDCAMIDSNCGNGGFDSVNSFSDDVVSKDDVCDDDGDGEGLKDKNVEEEQGRMPQSVNFVDHEKNDSSDLPIVFTRPVSSMTDCSNNDDDNSISGSPVKASLSARLFKKYNPEKSESDVDDFELFLQKIRTPKRVLGLSSEEQKREAKSIDEFIVDDDDDDLEEDVFMDPGFTPEEYDWDKENDDCIEIATPAQSCPPLKTPSTDCSWKKAESTKSVTNHTPFKTPASDYSWKAPKTKCDSALSSRRPKSALENLLSSYSAEKDFKKSRERLVQDLFELYNRTVFDNQLPSDFQVTWNKKMRSTAGFCYYSKKNGLRMSRIELADKVTDSADRLRDTLIHEMCHAASWVISGVKAGHGPVWKRWTMRANFVHQDLPPISRCHSYTINAKYTYRCTNPACANTFGRHSKSVNLEKSRCAYCHSRLELVPQLKKDGTPQTRTPSRFALFVKENFARIKKDNETFSHQEVMKALSSEFAKLST